MKCLESKLTFVVLALLSAVVRCHDATAEPKVRKARLASKFASQRFAGPVPTRRPLVTLSTTDAPDDLLNSLIASYDTSAFKKPIYIPLQNTATDAEPEQRLAYFREDVALNYFHWQWHLIYPYEGNLTTVLKDRRGELFYYIHEQIMARYIAERDCNWLPPLEPLSDYHAPIREGYFPKLDLSVASRGWEGRPPNMRFSNIDRRDINITFGLRDMELARERVLEAIYQGTVRNIDGSTTSLMNLGGIDILGDVIQASILSPNIPYYKDLHNFGHYMLGFIHDPQNRFRELTSIMGEMTTAMRDPAFYTWHLHMDDIFTLHKSSLPPYTPAELDFPGVTVKSVHTIDSQSNFNRINTFWTNAVVSVGRGLDFFRNDSVLVNITHMNHDPFRYSIFINNDNEHDHIGTVRIFLSPTRRRADHQFAFNDQRRLMIEMDKFAVQLPRKMTTSIERESSSSSVVLPFNITYQTLERGELTSENYCACGWPEHLMVPKGNVKGYPMDLFVMVTDYMLDRVEQVESAGCGNGESYCGLRERKYPDARPMGFPFDRPAGLEVHRLHDFLTPNMQVIPLTIKFTNVTRARREFTENSIIIR